MPSPFASLQHTEALARRALLDVTSYDVVLDLTGDLEASGATFASTTTIRLQSNGGATFLDVKPAALRALRLDGRPLDVDLLERGRFPLELPAGDHELVAEATMKYRNDGEGLHLSHDPADGRHYVYGMSFMDAAPSWFACFDQPDLKAPYTFHVSAPADWTVIGNSPATRVEPGRWELETSQPLSTYFVTLVAGPWHVIRDEHDGIPLGLSARSSIAADLDKDAEDILTVTKQCFDEFHRLFGIRYPFGDYHQAFVPEFNAGAMENPGCVTFRDPLIFTSRVTRAARINRAGTIAHEMAHQWFGNIVTPAWWDDLWLNESFAEYMGARVTADVTEYDDVWVDDVYARRQWGLVADQGPSTHPVASNGAVDATAALQDFDGISYAKGASVLKQLNAKIDDDDVFFAGAIDHFTRHRFGNATMSDLFESWERAGAGDLSSFTTNWLRTAGPDRLELDRTAGVLRRTPPEAHPADRPHTIQVAVHGDDGWTNHEVEVDSPRTPFDAFAAPVLVDPTADTWALTIPDEQTVDALATLLPLMTDEMLLATTWNSLRSALHNAAIDPDDALDLVVAALPVHDTEDTARRTMAWVFGNVIPLSSDPAAALARVHAAAVARTDVAAPDSGEQLAGFRVVVSTCGEPAPLRSWLAGDLPAGIGLDVDLRWRILNRLATIGDAIPDELDTALAAEPTASARVHHTRARASVPTAEAKAWAWSRFTGEVDVPNYELQAAGVGLWRGGQADVTTPYVDRYFTDLPETVNVRTGWVLADAAQYFFPSTSLEQETLDRAEALVADPELDLSLRRRLADEADELARKLAVLRAYPR